MDAGELKDIHNRLIVAQARFDELTAQTNEAEDRLLQAREEFCAARKRYIEEAIE